MISVQIMALRVRKTMTQAQLAHILNISPSTLGMYEQGRREPSIDILVSMANYFHVSLDYLITGADSSCSPVSCRGPKRDRCPCHSCFLKEPNM